VLDQTERLRAAFAAWNITIDWTDHKTRPHQQGVFCGTHYDMPNRRCRLAPSNRTKSIAACDILLSGTASWAQARAAIGRLWHAATILKFEWHTAYYLLKWYRRRCNAQCPPDAPAAVWPTAYDAVRSLRRLISANPWLPHHPPPAHPQLVLVTDASKRGAGAILFDVDTGSFTTWHRAWTTIEAQSPIHILEALAVSDAATYWAERLRGAHVTVRIDNTSVLAAARKKYAKDFYLNGAVGTVCDALRHAASFDVQFVRSVDNPSDELSRQKPLNDDKSSAFLRSVLVQRTTRAGCGVGPSLTST
jgi:hypothetical protein